MAIDTLVECNLEDTQPLYRTIDFFAAADIIVNSRLMFSRADRFSDKNEGVDHLLLQLESTRPNYCGGMGWNDLMSAKNKHESIKRSHYISCWSKTPESVAMWSLYSSDFTGVRISTQVCKLMQLLKNILNKYSISRFKKEDIGKNVIVATRGRISEVEYEHLSEITKKITRRVKAHYRIASRYSRQGRSLPTIGEVNQNYWQREKKRRLITEINSCNLKDISFQHENEVRAVVRLGEEKCHEYDLTNHEQISKFRLDSWGWVKSETLPEYEFSACPNNFIDTVAIDPRCPLHKARFMEHWFKEKGIRVVKSNCFGYIPNEFEVYPER